MQSENEIKKRVVVKLGTSTLTHKTGRLNIRRIERIVKNLADMHNGGWEIILVSSGAIGLGMAKLGLIEKPKDTPLKQACAAVGQCELMYFYDKMFSDYNLNVAQMLLTKYILLEDRKKNVQNALKELLKFNVIPIVNENDTVAIDELELEVGENDSLAATVAVLAEADMLVIMSDIDGLYDDDPRKNPEAKLISAVYDIDDHVRELAGGAGTALGKGGMKTKIDAAQIAVENGIDMLIVNGRDPDVLYDVFERKPVGTLFKAKENT